MTRPTTDPPAPGRAEPFAHTPSFHPADDTGSFLPQDFEAQYQALYAEALEAGDITEGDRERLALAARALGIPDERISALEQALEFAQQRRATITLTDPGEVTLDPSRLGEDASQRTSLVVPAAPDAALEPATGPMATERPVADEADEAPPTDPEPLLGGVAEDFDTSTTDAPPPPSSAEITPPTPLAHDAYETRDAGQTFDERPTPQATPAHVASAVDPWAGAASWRAPTFHLVERTFEDELHDRFAEMKRHGRIDAQFTTAAVLVRRGAANAEEQAFYVARRPRTLQRPSRPLTTTSWTSLLFHPHEDRTTGEIFAMVAPAALLARVSALGHDGSLVRLDPRRRQDPANTTVSAVRAVGWCAATLGLRTPPIYVAPELDVGLEIVPAVPPAARIGARMLSGPSALELAFQCARHLTWFREEHFICALVPAMEHLEDIFLAALLVAAPELPLLPEVRVRALLNRDAILPTLSPAHVERLRALTRAFLAAGGRTSIGRWARAAELTACRAGLLLCGDLAVACDALSREPGGADKATELDSFWASDAAAELRHELGVALT